MNSNTPSRFDALPKCEKCGGAQVHILNSSTLLDRELVAAREGFAIWIPHAKCSGVTAAACTSCDPNWLVVNEIGFLWNELQTEKEDYVLQGDLQRAGDTQDRQRELVANLNELLTSLGPP